MPYLLTPEAKSRIMHGEAAMEQQQHLSAAALQVRCRRAASRGAYLDLQGVLPPRLGGLPSCHLLPFFRIPSRLPPPSCPPPPFRPPAQALFQGVNAADVAFLRIRVRRTHVVEDGLNQLVYCRAEDLKKPLRVTFISGGVAEPAQVR